jgi:hypothetical protein
MIAGPFSHSLAGQATTPLREISFLLSRGVEMAQEGKDERVDTLNQGPRQD